VTSKPNKQNTRSEADIVGDGSQGPARMEKSGKVVARGKASPAPQALDRWFDDQLNQLFNDVSSEPLPADLANLIGQLKSQGQK
jgi:hypothetical protein